MSDPAPPWLELAHEDPERDRLRVLTPGERLAIFAELCDLGDAMLAGRPDRTEILRHRDAMAPEAEAQWRRLVARHRDG